MVEEKKAGFGSVVDAEVVHHHEQVHNQQSTVHNQHSTISHSHTQGSDDISLDLGAIKRFFVSLSSKKWLWIVVPLLIAIIASVVVRVPSLDQPFTQGWAQSTLENQFKSQALEQVRQQYPHLPSEQLNALVNEKLQSALKEQADVFAQQKQLLAQRFREQLEYDVDGVSYPYMPDIDPYHYLRYARNILDTGVISSVVGENGQLLDTDMLAPNGKSIDPLLHPYVIAWNHRLFSLFGKYPLPYTAGFVPIIIAALAVIPAFFLGRRYGGTLAGFFAGLFVSISPALVGRTMWGRADTDVYNILFPLLIVWLVVESAHAKKWWSRCTLAGVAGLTAGLYAFAWSGWWYMFDFSLFALGVGVIVSLVLWQWKGIVSERKRIIELCSIGAVYVLFTMIATGLILGSFFAPALNAMFAPLDFSQNIKDASQMNLWPNVYTTVAELNPGNVQTLVDQTTGTDRGFVRGLLVLLSLAGIVLAGFHKKRESWYDPVLVAFLAVWFFGTAYASLKGVRFVFLFAPAFSLAFGIGAGKLSWILSNAARRAMKIRTEWWMGLCAIVVFILLLTPYTNAIAIASSDVPIMNDGWFGALSKIRTDTSNTSIITSWWDFGHHFKYVAERRVTFDGASQNQPQASWVGTLLLTTDERESVGILRMLDCGGNKAFETVEKEIGTLDAHEVMDTIVTLDRADAEALLRSSNVSSVDKVLSLTHCTPPEAVLITSDDMVGKGGVWGHFGSWDHRRAYAWTVLRSKPLSEAVTSLKSLFNLSDAVAKQWYAEMQGLDGEDGANQWIAPWPGFMDIVDCSVSGDVVSCGSAKVDLSTGKGVLPTPQGERSLAVAMIKNGSFITVPATNPTSGVGISLVPNGQSFRGIFSHELQVGSIFSRLFFFDGHGLKYFDAFDERNQITGGAIKTWKTDWDGTTENKIDAFRVKDTVKTGDSVSVYYIGGLENGTLFDSSIPAWQVSNVSLTSSFDDFSPEKFTFAVGGGTVIKGFDDAVLELRVGEERTVTIPPARAYGIDPNAHPLGNKTLVFKVRVVEIK